MASTFLSLRSTASCRTLAHSSARGIVTSVRVFARVAGGAATKKSGKAAEPKKKKKLTPAAEMKLQGKRAKTKYDMNAYKMSLEDAINVIRAVEVRSPSSAYELLVKTTVARGRPTPRGRLSLPRDPRKHKEIVLVFAEPERAKDALAAGATYAGGLELVEKVLSGEIDPNKVFSTPGMLPQITPKLARFLGPKGLMPTTRRGTVTIDMAGALSGLEGKLEWKGDREGCIRVPIARVHFPVSDVVANIKAFLRSVYGATAEKEDPAGRKSASAKRSAQTRATRSASILSCFLSSRQGPGIELIQ